MNGSPCFSRATTLPSRAFSVEQQADRVLVGGLAGGPADVDALGVPRRQVEHARVNGAVVDHDISGLEALLAAGGDQPGPAGPGPHQEHHRSHRPHILSRRRCPLGSSHASPEPLAARVQLVPHHRGMTPAGDAFQRVDVAGHGDLGGHGRGNRLDIVADRAPASRRGLPPPGGGHAARRRWPRRPAAAAAPRRWPPRRCRSGGAPPPARARAAAAAAAAQPPASSMISRYLTSERFSSGSTGGGAPR